MAVVIRCKPMRAALTVLVLLVAGTLSCSSQKVFTLPNNAMEPTILNGEKFAVEMKPFQPARGDLVVFERDGLLLVKRVIAVAGDTIQGHNNEIFLNGSLISERYIQHIGLLPPFATFGPVTISTSKVFVAGDNRDYSFDSRSPEHGLISTGDIKGRPLKIVESSNRQRVDKPLQ